MGRYREERNSAVKRTKNMMRSQIIQSEGLAVHSEHNLPITGSHAAISIKGSLKEGPCYAPSSISVFLHGCREHTCCPHVMLLFLVPVSSTFLLLSSFDIPLAIVLCNEVCLMGDHPLSYSLQPQFLYHN